MTPNPWTFRLAARLPGASASLGRATRPAAPGRPSSGPRKSVWSGQRLASNVGGALDLDEYADAGICADMRLLARQQQLEDGVMDGPALVQCGCSVESQKAGIENAIALRLEVGVDHANALVVAKVFQRLFLRACPIGEMVIVENDHSALGRDVGTVRPLRRHEAWRAVMPGGPDECFDLFTDGHEVLSLRRLHLGRQNLIASCGPRAAPMSRRRCSRWASAAPRSRR